MADRAKATSKRSSIFGSWRSSSSRSVLRRNPPPSAPTMAPTPMPTPMPTPASGPTPTTPELPLGGLEGRELREATWEQQRQRESITQSVARPMRVIRYSPPRGNRTAAQDDEEDDDDDDMSTTDSARGTGGPAMFNYDDLPMHDDYSFATPRNTRKLTATNKLLSRSMHRHHTPAGPAPPPPSSHDHATSRLSLTFSRLSFSASARNSLADYKAKKYDVEWKKDSDVADCQVCHLAFTKWSRRRHHCRVCGDIICDACSLDQVHIDGRFTRAKRACAACVGLLEAMMHWGDPSVKMVVEKDAGQREWIDQTPPPQSPSTIATKQPLVYHDRLAEIQRVTAAGTKARRSGDVRQCVIKAQWLRAWLAFTSHQADDKDDDFDFPSAPDRLKRTHSVSSVHAPIDGRDPPGPIDNLSLLVMRKGCLLPRDGLVRIENQDFTGAGSNCGDYQTIPLEVWDVLSRYYGGGPRIDLVKASGAGEADRWVVDAAAVLRNGRIHKLQGNAVVGTATSRETVHDKMLERALMERHDPFCILLDMPTTSSSTRTIYDPSAPMVGMSTAAAEARPPVFSRSVSDSFMATAAASVGPGTYGGGILTSSGGANVRRANAKPPTAPPSHRPHSNGRTKPEPEAEPEPECTATNTHQTPPRNERGRRRRPGSSSSSSSGVAAAAGAPLASSAIGPSRSSRRFSGSPPKQETTAASAASAFAVAMKEARLKQQRAIAGGSSRSPFD